jgi:organic hydroperoxide reductase OsmC/OhrA
VWRQKRECSVSARRNPDLTVATPPEFGGPDGIWSPEELLVASVGSCLLSTFLYFAYRLDLSFESYSSHSMGTIEKTSHGLRFTGVDVSIAVTVSDDLDRNEFFPAEPVTDRIDDRMCFLRRGRCRHKRIAIPPVNQSPVL